MKSLQQQLLNAGLIDQNKAKKASKEKHKEEKAARKNQGKKDKSGQPAPNAMKARNAERDRDLNRQKQAQANRKAINAQIKQLIQMNRIDTREGEIPFNFIYQNKVKTLHTTEEIQRQLGLGRLAIVKHDQQNNKGFAVVPTVVADKISQRDQSYVIHIASAEQETNDEDDPYADYKVPDDLMW